jgi:hypothetical protein
MDKKRAMRLTCQCDLEYCHHSLRRLPEFAGPGFPLTTWGAFCLRVFDECSTNEVAVLLGISKDAVDIARSRVLSRVR